MKFAFILSIGLLAAALNCPAQTTNFGGVKQAREEFQMAQEALGKRQMATESFQRELDQLMEQKALWQRQIIHAKGKLGFAQEKLNYYTGLSVQEEMDRWQSEIRDWNAQLKTAVVELEKVEADIHDKVEELQTALKQNTESNLVLPGESIEVFVSEDETLNGVYQVRRGGYIVMPRVGRIDLAGKNLAEAERTIKAILGQSQIKDATVMVERPQAGGSSDSAVIYLAGEFLKPGAWKIPANVAPTIVTTVLRSGGLTPSADLTKVRLLRLVGGQALVEEVNVQAILSGAGLPSDITLQPGDIVMVPPFANVVYVTGNVVKPGALKLLPDDELTVYSAILRSGGFARFANRKKVYVLRDRGNGAKERVAVNISDLQNGKSSDLILRSKDIVVVPEKFFSF